LKRVQRLRHSSGGAASRSAMVGFNLHANAPGTAVMTAVFRR
jgi:hypothetical protein